MLRASSASPWAAVENLRRLLAGACHPPAPKTSETQRRPGVQFGRDMFPPCVEASTPETAARLNSAEAVTRLCPARRESPAWVPETLLELCMWGFCSWGLPPQVRLCPCLLALQTSPGAPHSENWGRGNAGWRPAHRDLGGLHHSERVGWCCDNALARPPPPGKGTPALQTPKGGLGRPPSVPLVLCTTQPRATGRTRRPAGDTRHSEAPSPAGNWTSASPTDHDGPARHCRDSAWL